MMKLKEEKEKLETMYLPKIKDTKKFQQEIHDELEKIKGDADMLPSMFRMEVEFRKRQEAEKNAAI